MEVEGEKNMNMQSRENVIQNLRDAGCNAQMIHDFLKQFDVNNKEEQLTLLEVQRKELLNHIHEEEKKISCLDYFIYQIKKYD